MSKQRQSKQIASAIPTHYRHGDVLIIAHEGAIPVKVKREVEAILAHGEVTGHAHRVTAGAHMFVEVDGQKWLDVFNDEATVTHEEHHSITLPRGRYRIVQQVEYSPEAIRPVLD